MELLFIRDKLWMRVELHRKNTRRRIPVLSLWSYWDCKIAVDGYLSIASKTWRSEVKNFSLLLVFRLYAPRRMLLWSHICVGGRWSSKCNTSLREDHLGWGSWTSSAAVQIELYWQLEPSSRPTHVRWSWSRKRRWFSLAKAHSNEN